MAGKVYTVVPIAKGMFAVHDMTTGAQLNRFNIPGDLVSGPIVSVDTCSITTRNNGLNTTYVVRIPNGAIINRFCT